MQHAARRMRTQAAAEYVGLSPRTLEAIRHRGGGPAFAKIGRAVVYDAQDLDNWLSAHRQAAPLHRGEANTGVEALSHARRPR